MIRDIVILGSTGSIGRNALRVCAALRGTLRPVALSAERRWNDALEQALEWGIGHIAITDIAAAKKCRDAAPANVTVYDGPNALVRMVESVSAHTVLCGVVGLAGLPPVLAALKQGRNVALATKEALVAGGELVIEAAERHGVRLLPVDSELNALFQCLLGHEKETVRRLILTASGGPFHAHRELDLTTVTPAEALAHPSWTMGPKVTIDSATLMNKGLELIEATRFFGVPVGSIDVRIHPQSVIHSMVEFTDGALLAQLSVPDMRYAIQYALTFPERLDGGLPALTIGGMRTLTFDEPDTRRFPALGLARSAAETGGTMPAVLNGANEAAVQAFLRGRIAFTGIVSRVAAAMAAHSPIPRPTLDDIFEADRWARDCATMSGRGTAQGDEADIERMG